MSQNKKPNDEYPYTVKEIRTTILDKYDELPESIRKKISKSDIRDMSRPDLCKFIKPKRSDPILTSIRQSLSSSPNKRVNFDDSKDEKEPKRRKQNSNSKSPLKHIKQPIENEEYIKLIKTEFIPQSREYNKDTVKNVKLIASYSFGYIASKKHQTITSSMYGNIDVQKEKIRLIHHSLCDENGKLQDELTKEFMNKPEIQTTLVQDYINMGGNNASVRQKLNEES